MGKAARNEKRKLAATYFNNIAVGVLVAGFLIPYVQIGSTGHLWVPKIRDWSFSFPDLLIATTAFWGMSLSVLASWAFRRIANTIIKQVEGE